MGSVIFPSLTDQMVLGVFKYLIEAELRKNIEGQQEFRFGCQEGMMASLIIMFGGTDDLTAKVAYDNGESWLHIVEEIRDNLQTWIEALDNAESHTEVDFDGLQDAVDKAVNDYALKHPKKLGDALRIFL